MPNPEVSKDNVEVLHERLRHEAAQAGYRFNPDGTLTRELVKGILVNTGRYGYGSCPCRLASGNPSEDRDIVCPCDYRDPDLSAYGACYCALYVSAEVAEGKRQVIQVPERRLSLHERKWVPETGGQRPMPDPGRVGTKYPVWRCGVCGYLCARTEPPELCPICKANKNRFERFL